MALKISVIIPCYNSQKYIKKTIDSVLTQEKCVDEIICVDDSSKDETVRILKGYGSKLKLLQHPNGINRGCAASLNLAVELASGDYIAFLDHDDIWLPNKILRQTAILDANPDVAMVYTNGIAVSPEGKYLFQILPDDHVEKNDVNQLLLDCYIKSCSAVMIRKETFTIHGPFDERLIAMDHDLWLKIGEQNRIEYLAEPLYLYLLHPYQNSHRRQLWEDGLIILNEARHRYPYGRLLSLKRKAVLHYRLGCHDLKSGHFSSSLMHFFAAALYDPIRAFTVVFGKMA